MSKRIKFPNGVIYIEGKLSKHEEDEFYRQMTPKRILRSNPNPKQIKNEDNEKESTIYPRRQP